ncbi:MAG: hypothetical protein ACK41Y_16320, partial [Paracoccus hibiscisoli]|uniref:hypothetical protein n=1 Tax=Paracoccus hibiscisoli TaxID=2023261 RepID=UPI0039198C77
MIAPHHQRQGARQRGVRQRGAGEESKQPRLLRTRHLRRHLPRGVQQHKLPLALRVKQEREVAEREHAARARRHDVIHARQVGAAAEGGVVDQVQWHAALARVCHVQVAQ